MGTFLQSAFAVLVTVSIGLPIEGATPDVCTVRPVDVLFLLDASGSVTSTNFEKAKDFVDKFRTHVKIGDTGFLLSVMTFSSDTHVEFYLNSHTKTSALATAIQNVRYSGGGTDTASALKQALSVFSVGHGMRTINDVRHYAVVMTDGQSNFPAATKKAAVQLKASGKVDKVFSIGIGSFVNKTELKDIASSPDGDIPNTVFLVADYKTLLTLVEQMVDITCDGVDSCVNNTCVHGDCVHTVDSYTCRCYPGYSGTNCEINIDECASDPCMNAGLCVDRVNSYICLCIPGFTGNICQTNINECNVSPCQNGGTCFDGINGYTCICRRGFTGAKCEKNINNCQSNLCQNNATCADGLHSYTCTCAPGYTGLYCEIEIDECLSNPCQHSGTCVDLVDGYNCTCKLGYKGSECQIEPVLDNLCVNHFTRSKRSVPEAFLPETRQKRASSPTSVLCCVEDTCLQLGSQCQTEELLEYLCRKSHVACSSTRVCGVDSWCPGNIRTSCTGVCEALGVNRCQNGGTCQPTSDYQNFTCACPTPYTGDRCEKLQTYCSKHPCLHGFNCIEKVGDYQCNCSRQYIGKNCDVNLLGPRSEICRDSPSHKCYLIFHLRKTWQQAKDYCHGRGGTLFVPNNLDEQQFVEDYLKAVQASLSDTRFWIGATSAGQDHFTWLSSGGYVADNRWPAGRDGYTSSTKCLTLAASSQYMWTAKNCDETAYFICEEREEFDEWLLHHRFDPPILGK